MFNTLNEAIERRNADMKLLAETLARETHARGWNTMMKEWVEALNPSLAHMIEFSEPRRAVVKLRVGFRFNDSIVLRGVYGQFNYEQIRDLAVENESWDANVQNDVTSLFNDNLGIIVIDSITFPSDE